MIIVTGTVTARADSFAMLRAAGIEHTHRSRTEDGCISHEVAIDCDDPLRLIFLERWRDRAALEAHFRVPALRRIHRRDPRACSSIDRPRHLSRPRRRDKAPGTLLSLVV